MFKISIKLTREVPQTGMPDWLDFFCDESTNQKNIKDEKNSCPILCLLCLKNCQIMETKIKKAEMTNKIYQKIKKKIRKKKIIISRRNLHRWLRNPGGKRWEMGVVWVRSREWARKVDFFSFPIVIFRLFLR